MRGRCWCVLLVVAVGLVACKAGPPRLADVEHLAHVELLATRSDLSSVRIYHTLDIPDDQAEALLPQVAAVCSTVHGLLGRRPPRTELILYEPQSPVGIGHHVLETRGDLFQEETGWRIRFFYPWSDSQQSLVQLLGTTAHEVAESTVLLHVTVIDPYLRWVHDGIAELIEHEVLLRLQPTAARADLARMVRFVQDRRADGVTTIDLTRWRQLAPYVVRSHRLLGPGEENLALDRIPAALAKVRRARRLAQDPILERALGELELVLLHAGRVASRPWRPGEARPDDALTQDYLYYNAAFALWLSMERARPGAARSVLSALGGLRAADEHVLRADEALEVVQAASGHPLPDLERLPLEWVEGVLREEAARAP